MIVDATDNQLRPLPTAFKQADLDAICRGSIHGPGRAAGCPFDRGTHQWPEKGDRLAHTALFLARRHHCDIAQLAKFVFQRRQARGINAIVVGEQNVHKPQEGQAD